MLQQQQQILLYFKCLSVRYMSMKLRKKFEIPYCSKKWSISSWWCCMKRNGCYIGIYENFKITFCKQKFFILNISKVFFAFFKIKLCDNCKRNSMLQSDISLSLDLKMIRIIWWQQRTLNHEKKEDICN